MTFQVHQGIIEAMISGLVGTAGMTLVMWLITRSGLAHADTVSGQDEVDDLLSSLGF